MRNKEDKRESEKTREVQRIEEKLEREKRGSL
jgi:hypothetical protein